MSDWHTPVEPTPREYATMLRNWTIVPELGIVVQRRTGRILGSENADGYWVICVGGTTSIDGKRRLFKIHHIIWWGYYGEWPTTLLDHEDTNRGHNWISNLRNSTPSANSLNRKVGS